MLQALREKRSDKGEHHGDPAATGDAKSHSPSRVAASGDQEVPRVPVIAVVSPEKPRGPNSEEGRKGVHPVRRTLHVRKV